MRRSIRRPGTVDTAITSFTIPAATGGSGVVAYVATGLPTGVSMSAGRVVSGTPSAADTGTAIVTASDASEDTATLEFDWTVATADGAPMIWIDDTDNPDTDPYDPYDLTTLYVDENTTAFPKYRFIAKDTDEDSLTWTLDGTDKDVFTFDGATGLLSVAEGKVLDYETQIEYVITLTVSDGTASDTAKVTVKVADADEAGTVSFDPAGPVVVGVAATATLSDPDGGVTGVTWQWARSSSRSGAFTDIGTATGASYTPVAGDENNFLRATASYTDAFGAGKSASAVTGNAATADTAPSFGNAEVPDLRLVVNTESPGATLPPATGGNGDLRYSLTAPAALSFAPATRRLSGTPSTSQAATSLHLHGQRRRHQQGGGRHGYAELRHRDRACEAASTDGGGGQRHGNAELGQAGRHGYCRLGAQAGQRKLGGDHADRGDRGLHHHVEPYGEQSYEWHAVQFPDTGLCRQRRRCGSWRGIQRQQGARVVRLPTETTTSPHPMSARRSGISTAISPPA